MITKAQRDDIMTSLIATGGPYDPAATWIGVLTAVTNHGIDTVIGDVTEPTGDPGDRQLITTWGTPYDLTDGRRVVDGPVMQFRPASSAEACTLLGWAVWSAATAGILLQFESLGQAVPLPDEDTAWSIVFRLTVDPDGRYSASITFNG